MQFFQRGLADCDEMFDLLWIIKMHLDEIKNVAQHLDGVREPTQRG